MPTVGGGEYNTSPINFGYDGGENTAKHAAQKKMVVTQTKLDQWRHDFNET